MPQERKERRPPGPEQPTNEPEKRRRNPSDDQLDDLIKDAEELIKKNKDNTERKQPGRQ